MKIDSEINIIMHGLRMNRKLLGNGGNYLPNYEKEYRAVHTKNNKFIFNCKEKHLSLLKC